MTPSTLLIHSTTHSVACIMYHMDRPSPEKSIRVEVLTEPSVRCVCTGVGGRGLTQDWETDLIVQEMKKNCERNDEHNKREERKDESKPSVHVVESILRPGKSST